MTVKASKIVLKEPEFIRGQKNNPDRGYFFAPKIGKTTLSANKLVATVFWDEHDIIHVDCLEMSKTNF